MMRNTTITPVYWFILIRAIFGCLLITMEYTLRTDFFYLMPIECHGHATNRLYRTSFQSPMDDVIPCSRIKYSTEFLIGVRTAMTDFKLPMSFMLHLQRLGILRRFRGCRSGLRVKLRKSFYYPAAKNITVRISKREPMKRNIMSSCSSRLASSCTLNNIISLTCVQNEPKNSAYASAHIFVSQGKTVRGYTRPRTLVKLNDQQAVNKESGNCMVTGDREQLFPTSLYILNACSIAKPHAMQQLRADIDSLKPDIVIITESWLTKKHSDELFQINGYSIFRRDRAQLTAKGKDRVGGGVVIYIKHCYQAKTFIPVSDVNKNIDLLWICIQRSNRSLYLGGIYHPPNPVYKDHEIIHLLETSLDEIERSEAGSLVLLAGDFNLLPNCYIHALGLSSEIIAPTRNNNHLDRIYTSEPFFSSVRVLSSTVKSDHKAIYAHVDPMDVATNNTKTKKKCNFRRCSPGQNAKYLDYLALNNKAFILDIDFDHSETQPIFDKFYQQMNYLLNLFYPVKTITVTSKDPPYVTPTIKCMLRRKNKLMRQGKMEAASSLAKIISKHIIAKNSATFSKSNPIKNSKDLWERVRMVTGKGKGSPATCGITMTAADLNAYYSNISTDPFYEIPTAKNLAQGDSLSCFFSEEDVFKILDGLRPTSPGLDELPSWFLRLSAPLLAKSLTDLFNLSLSRSEVPNQWKSSVITPVAKINKPVGCADYRPISITPLLSRVMEKLVVRKFLYPVLVNPDVTPIFSDQFAFRPTGSTTAAIIALTYTIALLLQKHPYIHLIALDFSKAFDTVKHAALLRKCAALPLENCVHNWLVSYLEGRDHCTKFNGSTSTRLPINASIVQGSGLGPVAYIITASDFTPIHLGNMLIKYADDSYLIVPSTNTQFVREELEQVEHWAKQNNLKLNSSKTKEIIFRKQKLRLADLPPIHDGIARCETMNILGVLLQSNLSFREHVIKIVSQSAQTLYALRTLRSQGLSGPALWEVTEATLVSRLTYASPSWWGFLDAGSRHQLQSLFKKIVKQGFLQANHPSFSDIAKSADNKLFSSVLKCPQHVLYQYLPPILNSPYNLRPRAHNREISLTVDSIIKKTFITRMIHFNSF